MNAQAALALATALLAFGQPALAAISNTQHATDPAGSLSGLDPGHGGDGTPSWPAPPWSHTTPPDGVDPNEYSVLAGQMMAVGMDNVANLANYKAFVIYVDFTGGVPPAPDLHFGYFASPGSSSATLARSENLGGILKLTYWITPQPDWEYIIFTNPTQDKMVLSNITMFSNCFPIPAPGGLGVMTGALVLLRRRPRA